MPTCLVGILTGTIPVFEYVAGVRRFVTRFLGLSQKKNDRWILRSWQDEPETRGPWSHGSREPAPRPGDSRSSFRSTGFRLRLPNVDRGLARSNAATAVCVHSQQIRRIG